MHRNLLIVLLCIVLSGIRLSAQEGVIAEVNLAVEFVVDRSNNLFGGFEVPANQGAAPGAVDDGADLTASIALHGIQWLASFQAQQASVGRSPRIDVAVGAFGTDYNPVLPWTRLDADDFEAAESNFDSLSATINAQLPVSMGQTDYINALQGARNQLNSLNSQTDVADSQRVIVLITDGIPCARERSEWRSQDGACEPGRAGASSSEGAGGLHIAALGATLIELEEAGVRVEFLSISDDYTSLPRLNNAWQALVNEEILGEPRSITADSAIGGVMNELMFDILPEGYAIGSQLEAGTQDINPYLAQMTVTLYKAISSEHLSLTPRGGAQLTDSSPNVRVVGEDMLVEVWTIDNPLPGEWIVSGGNGAIYLDTTPIAPRLEIDQERFAFQKVDIVLSLGEDGELPSYPSEYTLKGGLLIAPEGGTPQQVNLNPDPTNPGRFTASYTPESAVRHAVLLEVEVDEGQLPSGLLSYTSSFNAAPVQVFIEGLDSAERPLRGEPRTFRLHLRDTRGQPVPDIEVRQFQLAFPPVGETTCPTGDASATTTDGLTLLDPQITPTNPATWLITYTFPNNGLQLVCPMVKIRDLAKGQESTLMIRGYTSAVQLDVEQEQRVLLTLNMDNQTEARALSQAEVDDPTTWVTYRYANPFFAIASFFVTPEARLVVRAYNVNESGQRGAPAPVSTQLLQADEDPAEYLCLSITGGDGRNLMKEKGLKLNSTDDPSQWNVMLGTLPTGEYTVRVEALNIPQQNTTDGTIETVDADLACYERGLQLDTGRIGDNNFRFDPQPVVLARLIVSTDNTSLYLVGGVVLGAAALVSTTFFTVTRKARRRIGAVQGSLRISRDGETIQTIPLYGYNANDITVKATHLPIVEPPIVHMNVKSADGKILVSYGFESGRSMDVELTQNHAHPLAYSSWRGGVYTITWVNSRD